jgi:hypothetical protein
MITCSGGEVGPVSGGDLAGEWGNVRSRLCLTLAAADAEIWGGWRVVVGRGGSVGERVAPRARLSSNR